MPLSPKPFLPIHDLNNSHNQPEEVVLVAVVEEDAEEVDGEVPEEEEGLREAVGES